MGEAIPRPLVFALNGERVELTQPDPSMTLSTYLRTQAGLTGTKVGCGEGGCGACLVFLSRHNRESKRIEEFTVNACLALLCSLDGCAVTTIEGIGSSTGKLHAVQDRFSGFHASQCGYCTPGMCMAVYGFLHQRRNENGKIQAQDIGKSVTGNICRCTGYRPILDVCNSFAADVDVEDLGLNTFSEGGSRAMLPAYNSDTDNPKFPQFLVELSESPLRLENSQGRTWIQARSLEELTSLLQTSRTGATMKLVVGNTSAGIYKDLDAQVFVDISRVPELLDLKYGDDRLEVGAAVTFSKLISFLKEIPREEVYQHIADHLNKVASPHVRNRASVGGNLILSQKFSFESDLATVLLGVGASVKLMSRLGKQVVLSLDEFLGQDMESDSVLLSVIIPSFTRSDSVMFRSYRASPRPFGNAVSLINSAFLVHLLKTPTGDRVAIEKARLALGAFGGNHAIRVLKVEDYLAGKTLNDEIILNAIKLLKCSFTPEDETWKASYKKSVAVGFLYKFLSELLQSPRATENGHTTVEMERKSPRLMTSKQVLRITDDYHPVGQGSRKVQSDIQATGEAVYVDDIPSPPNCLHAAFVYSSKALAKVKGINLRTGLASQGAVAFVSEQDIPPGGQNVGVITDGSREPLFATDSVHYVGQPLGLMLADTSLHARAAAEAVEVDYDCEALGTPMTTIEDAVARNSYFELWPFAQRMLMPTVGDVSAGFAEAAHKIESVEVRTGSQYFFYMETQAALAIPDEDNCIVVYSACQGPEYVQRTISQCLGIPMHNVRVITRRLGGAFGGKAFKPCIVATACAIAAFKLRRPVRMSLDRNTDMIMMGGRHMTKAIYSVGFTAEGKVTALKLDVFLQGGWGEDMSPALPLTVSSTLKKYNWGAFEMNFKVCRTNIPARTAMRAPGDTQGSFIADTVLEHVAAFLNMDPYVVIEKNMHNLQSLAAYYGPKVAEGSDAYLLPTVWEEMKRISDFERKIQQVNSFNSRNKWKKKGFSMIPCVYKIQQFPRQARASIFSDSSVVIEVAGIEMGQGLWTKVRQAAAYGLSKLWDGEEHVDMSRIRVVQADSLSLPNGGMTSGSSTSEGTCEAVNLACKILVERLMPVKARLKNPTWESLISHAHMTKVDLSAQSYFADISTYLTFGAAATEVEIDVISGETSILETQMVYDCGKSMNPAVDIGQIEGAFVQGIGFFMTEEYAVDENGRLVTDGTWTYKPPTIDNLPKVLNVHLLNSPVNKKRILSSKASGEPPLLLASSVHCAIRDAIKAARQDKQQKGFFRMDTPATIDKVKMLCGYDNVETFLEELKISST